MNSSFRSLPVLAGALFAAQLIATAAVPRVVETIVGPANAGGIYVLSPGSGHVAYMGMKGTRFAVTVDGVEGPEFDELYTSMGASFFFPAQTAAMESTPGWPTPNSLVPVVFSLTGGHCAYAARQGNEYVVIFDGKEIARGPRDMLSLNYGWLKISPAGEFVTFMEIMKSPAANAKWRLVVNGKPGPWSSTNHGMEPVFDHAETRYAYNVAGENDVNAPVLVVDGKVASYVGIKPVFTADGKKLLTVSPVSVASPKTAVLVDGKAVISPLGVDKIIPGPVGAQWGAIVRTKLEGITQVAAFFLDGKEVPGTEGAKNAVFSHDGKHYAVICENTAARSLFVVLDGKKQNEYPGMGIDETNFRWTPDGSKFIYSVNAGGRPFVVVNDQEFPVDYMVGTDPIALAQTGHRYGFATRDGSNQNFKVMIDGQSVLPAGYTPVDQTLAFSPDGATDAYFVGNVGRQGLAGVIVNGTMQEGLMPTYFSKWNTFKSEVASIKFSPDGQHMVFMAASDPQAGYGLHVDGTMVYPTRKPLFFPTFTPDSQHLFWMTLVDPPVRGQQPPTVVYVDGEEAARADTHNFQGVSGVFVMDDVGAVTFFGVDGDNVKRYHLTAPTDTSVATLLEKGAQLKATAAAAVEAAKAQAAEQAAAAQKAKDDAAALYAKQREEQAARAAAANQARLDALEARRKARLLQLENAKRARQGLPPLTALPE